MQEIDLKPTVEQISTRRRRSSDAQASSSQAPQNARKVSRDTLINRLNYLHFQSLPCYVQLDHAQYGRKLRLQARPQPCVDESLSCLWLTPPGEAVLRGDFRITALEIPYGHHVLQVEVGHPELTEQGLNCKLPEVCHELTSRRIRRHACQDIDVELIASGSIFKGGLADFSAAAFRLELEAEPPQTFTWLESDDILTVVLKQAGQTLLTTPCRLLRHEGDRRSQSVVLVPEATAQRRFPPKKHRSRRLELNPAPLAVFTHPLSGHLLSLDVVNISGSGLAVIEDPHEAQLLPGMTLHSLELRLTDTLSLTCQAQVIHRRLDPEDDHQPVECGLALLDMDVPDHTRLMALLHRAENRRKRVCPEVDLDRLWEFFFASGFIYPQKYQSMQEYRESFRETYTKLYTQAPDIARHFVYQEKNHIAGHLAMLRLASNSWMIHHHAADRTRARQAGLDTLQLVGEAVNEAQGLFSSHMDYVLCFYRPENRFPKRVFGGVANHYDDPSRCSVDTLAYFHYRKDYDLCWKDGGPWELTPAQSDDLLDVEAFYQQRSGGLMLHGLDLTAQRPDQADLDDAYRKAGLQRKQSLFTLKRDGAMVALFMVLNTELGLNLSNLTNAITVLVMDPKSLPREAFFTAVSMLAALFPEHEVPVMVYPDDFAKEQALEVEKHYNLWVLDCHDLDPYFDYCENYFKRSRNKEEDAS